MNKPPIEIIELEMALLSRRLTSMSTYKKIGTLDHSAYLLLNQIASHGSAGVKALSDEFRLDISTVSRQAAALEQKGYVSRVPDPNDGRAYTLQISRLGLETLNENVRLRKEQLGKVLEDWSGEERERFGQLLQKLNESISDKL
ncbi:MarR family transcriptional regulator [Paenibacillus sp. PK3_47]|uniref:MarR family winged helix-turn-helix transcriptional regulator n=1 Tax=Paenibacillus sp. PK3_47 TaxID=2072642 RepID=UPI00201DA48E|nr:MarR family transcriptional regulator [Paenibacillus sp. PK3_47]UQZ35636.1 MarR family transcriptional regulator [Paenibacillus sp. PK3_47]